MSEQDERPRGLKGDKGEQGERGDLSLRLRRSLVYLFATAAGLAVIALLVGFREISAIRAQAAQNIAAQHREQVEQRRAGLVFERDLCSTFGKAAALKAPAGNPRKNPSRAYLQGEHLVWTGVLADLKCSQLTRN